MEEAKLNNSVTSTTIEEIHPDILNQVLNHLDGTSLASVNSATSYLRSISSHPDLWRYLCLSTWPSLHHPRILPLVNSSPHRFFSDVFPYPTSFTPTNNADLPDELISAVDLYKNDIPISSFVLESDTSSPNPLFHISPFVISGPDIVTDVLPEELTLSWIVIDPTTGRAVNLSSRRAMVVRRHCLCWEAVARFTTARDGWVVGVLVKWWDEGLGLVELHLTIWDEGGAPVSYMEGLRVVMAAMDAERKALGEEEANEGYFEYYDIKINKEE
ncbi:F-box protein At2g27310-like, partial [Dendrobium catenatum]